MSLKFRISGNLSFNFTSCIIIIIIIIIINFDFAEP